MKTLLGSASKLHRTLNCPASHHLPQIAQPSDKAVQAAERGSRLHKLLEVMNPDALSQDEFLSQFSPSDFVGYRTPYREVALIHDSPTGKVRIGEADRQYEIKAETETPGTIDVAFTGFRTVEVWDYKFGEHPVKAENNPQLLHGALMVWKKLCPTATVFVLGVQQVNSKGISNDTWVCDRFTLNQHEARIKAAQLKARSLDVYPDNKRGYGYCMFCAARPVCPAWNG